MHTRDNRTRIILVAALLAAVACVSIYVLYFQNHSSEITIGAIVLKHTPSGDPLPTGMDTLAGMELAAETINNSGGVNGRKIRLEAFDCKSNADLAKEGYNKIAGHDPIAVVTMYSHISIVLGKLSKEHEIPQLAVIATAEDLLENAPYTFRYWPPASYESEAALPIITQLGTGKLGIVYIDNTYGISVFNEMREDINALGINHFAAPYTAIGKDLPQLAAQLKTCDAIYYVCFPNQLVELTTYLKEAFPGVPLIGPNSISSPDYSPIPVFEGVHVAAPLIYSKNFPFAVRVSKQFSEKTGKPLSHYSAVGYDVINLLAEMIASGSNSREALKNRLEGEYIYPGLFGDVVKPGGTRESTYPLYPARIANGTVRYSER